MTTDIHYNVDLDMYFADSLTMIETLSQSCAKTIVFKSEHHAWAEHPRYGNKKRKQTFSMKTGSIIDEVMTNQERRLMPIPFDSYRTKEAKAAKEAAIGRGLIPVKQAELDSARDRAATVNRALLFNGIDLEPMEKQVCLLWEERASNGNVVQCKCLLDYFLATRGLIIDLKSTENACPGEKLDRKAIGLGYHLQAAAYISAVEHVFPDLVGRARFQNVWVEDEWPYEPCVSSFGGDALMLGRSLWQQGIDRWEVAQRTNTWPGYMRKGQVHTIELSAWQRDAMLMDDEEEKADEDEPDAEAWAGGEDENF